MSTVEVRCKGCSSLFHVRKAEWNRRTQRNPACGFFCSNRCQANHGGKYNLGAHLGMGRVENFGSRRGRQKDEHSPFRYFLLKARGRPHGETTDLDLPYLKALWESQAGQCALSGITMNLPSGVGEWMADKHNPWKPSLDRVDSSRGYVRGNVRFVTLIANLCKQSFTDDVVLTFAEAVVRQHALLVQVEEPAT